MEPRSERRVIRRIEGAKIARVSVRTFDDKIRPHLTLLQLSDRCVGFFEDELLALLERRGRPPIAQNRAA